MFTLQAEPRSTGMKAKHLRKRGLVPACLYGEGIERSLSLQIPHGEVKRLLKLKSRGGRVILEVAGERSDALLREIGRNPAGGQIEHLGFQKLSTGGTVTSTAKIVLVNKEKIPLYIQQVLFDVPYRAAAPKLLETIEINLDGMHAGDCVRARDLSPFGEAEVELLINPDSLVLSIVENKRLSYLPQAT